MEGIEGFKTPPRPDNKLQRSEFSSEIIRLGNEGVAPQAIAKALGCSRATVYYHLERAGLWKRVEQRRGRKPDGGRKNPYADRVAKILETEALHQQACQAADLSDAGLVFDELPLVPDLTSLPPPPPARPHRTLEEIETEGPAENDIGWLEQIRRDPRGTVTDRLRATEALLRWRKRETDDLHRELDDEEFCALLVDLLTAIPEKLRERVLSEVTQALSQARP